MCAWSIFVHYVSLKRTFQNCVPTNGKRTKWVGQIAKAWLFICLFFILLNFIISIVIQGTYSCFSLYNCLDFFFSYSSFFLIVLNILLYKKITIEHSYYFISPYSNFSHKKRDVIFPTNTRDVCVLYGHGDQNVSPMPARDVSVSRSKNWKIPPGKSAKTQNKDSGVLKSMFKCFSKW